MTNSGRREILKDSTSTTLGIAGGLRLPGDARSAQATPANDKLNLAIIGCRGRGNTMVQAFAARSDCEFTSFCDVEQGHLSTLLVHYSTISYRLGGEKLTTNPATEGIVDKE